jgi:hypothetical protein
MQKNTPKEAASDELLQANLGMFGNHGLENTKVAQLKRMAERLKNKPKKPE